MTFSRIDVREIKIGRRFDFYSSRGKVAERRILIVTVYDKEGRQGWGECAAPEEPRYCEEWTEAAWQIINELLVPSLLSQTAIDITMLRDHFDQFRGNRMAKAAVELACWDLEARRRQVPLWHLVGGDERPIPCGVSLGIRETVEDLMTSIEQELTSGYRRIKLKIKPGWDLNVLEAVRGRFPKIVLMVDANGAYRSEDMNKLRALDGFGLSMIEQPFAPEDLWSYREARECLKTPICLDETVVSSLSAKALLNFELCDIVNVKLGRVGGFIEAKELVTLCAERGIQCWCGGQHEAGLGRAHNIALAALMPRDVPSDLSASSRYWIKDIISPEIVVDAQGYLHPPTAVGCGFEIDRPFVETLTTRSLIHHE